MQQKKYLYKKTCQ